MRRGDLVRQSAAVSAALLAALFLLPLAVVAPFRTAQRPEEPPRKETPQGAEEPPFAGGPLDGETVLRTLDGGTVKEMALGTYLAGVVRAEMPASFAPEALKAQAVAARTYTLYKMRSGGNHGDSADICTDFACCQAYLSEEQARENWGENAAVYEEKIERAVTETDGQAILYNGEPILAVFQSSSAGLTRAAGEVWQGDLPYLQAVASPEQGESIPNYYSRVEFAAEELREILLKSWPEAALSGELGGWLGEAVTDSAGSVDTLSVGGVTVRGTELRGALGLRSACFTWEAREDALVFYVTGYGHGVGLSQYGANQMAEEGAGYEEILTHYYTGVAIGPASPG